MQWCSWWKLYTISWKVTGLIPTKTEFFNWPNPSSCTVTLELTQPLTEMSTTNLPGGVKCSRHMRLIISPPYMRQLSRIYEILDVSNPYRSQQPVARIAFLFYCGKEMYIFWKMSVIRCTLILWTNHKKKPH
jgi:hypothetical protein